MIKSMTGFGFAKAINKNIELEIHLKAYNGRFLSISLQNLPKEYQLFEREVTQKIKKFIQRGTLNIYITCGIPSQSALIEVTTHPVLVKKWAEAYKQISRILSLPEGSKLTLDLSSFQHLIIQKSVIRSHEKQLFLTTFNKALFALDIERKREGKALLKELKALISLLSRGIRSIEILEKQTPKNLQKQLKDKLRSMSLSYESDPKKWTAEMFSQISKCDITEEVVRLKEHLRAFQKGLTSPLKGREVKGKKLDFYTQEMFREVNTIAMKSSHVKTCRLVVESKSLIEKIKEQVQNIE